MNIGKYIEMYSGDLKFKNYADNTLRNYCNQVRDFLTHFAKVATKPSEINEAMIKDYIMLAQTTNSRKHRISAIKLFYSLTGKQPLKFRHIPFPRSERKLPRVIDKDFLINKINLIENIKHKAIIALAYSVGLRVSEVINLKTSDIDSVRMIITIRQAKGNKDRIVPLSETMLKLLRAYYTEHRPEVYLFNGQGSGRYSAASCNQIIKKYIGPKYHFHLLRHSSATSLLAPN